MTKFAGLDEQSLEASSLCGLDASCVHVQRYVLLQSEKLISSCCQSNVPPRACVVPIKSNVVPQNCLGLSYKYSVGSKSIECCPQGRRDHTN